MFAFEKLQHINKIRGESVCVPPIASNLGFVLGGISDSEAGLMSWIPSVTNPAAAAASQRWEEKQNMTGILHRPSVFERIIRCVAVVLTEHLYNTDGTNGRLRVLN